MKRSDAYAVIAAAALWLLAAGLYWGTWAAGSADSYGYISQASLWLRGDLVVDQPIARMAPWPDADWTFSPLGYRPGLEAGTIVPIYPPGLPIMMAMVQWAAGPQAVYLLVPLFAGVTALAAAILATRMSSLTAGAFAAFLLASSPTLLFASMWPMSDVPASALWTLALVLATSTSLTSAAGAGAAAGLAILTRPNLVLLACVPGVYLVWQGGHAHSNRRRAIGRLLLFAAPVVAGCLAVAGVNMWLYGSPLRSGHGDLNESFSVSAGAGNAGSIAGWLVTMEPALALLGLAGVLTQVRRKAPKGVRELGGLCVGAVTIVFVSYAFFISNVDWWFVRFLVPAFPALAALGGAGMNGLAERMSNSWRVVLLGSLAFLIVTVGVSEAVRRGAFSFRTAESRYEIVGAFVARDLPANAVLFASQESGSLRYYGGRPTIRFDLLAPEWLEPAIAFLQEQGYRPYFVIDEFETAAFTQRFEGATPLGRLDFPPTAEFPGQVPVRIFDPEARQAQGP